MNHLDEGWDLAIFHPECTYLTVTGNKWFKPEFKDRFPEQGTIYEKTCLNDISNFCKELNLRQKSRVKPQTTLDNIRV